MSDQLGRLLSFIHSRVEATAERCRGASRGHQVRTKVSSCAIPLIKLIFFQWHFIALLHQPRRGALHDVIVGGATCDDVRQEDCVAQRRHRLGRMGRR